MPTLLWLRRDLRLHDLPPLLDATAPDGDVLACYVLDPRLKASSGPRRLQYLYDALRDLHANLDGRLMVTRGQPHKRIPLLAKEIGATSVHVSADYSPFGRRRDGAVREALGDVPLEEAGSPYLVSPGRVTKRDGTPYKVFTPFYDAWREHGWPAPANSGPTSARWIDPADVPGGVDIPDAGVELEVQAGEGAARKQWARFVDSGLDDYADERDRPDLDGTSRMSAHLKFGTIHPRTMAADLGRGKSAQAYRRELAFRDFYAAVLYEWPKSAWINWNRAFDAIQVDDDRDAARVFEAWKAGRTGFPIVDAGMRQLAATGFMHNRAHDRRVISGQGSPPPVAVGSAVVSGAVGRRRYGQQRSSTQTVPTSAGGCPRLTTTTIPRRSSTMPRNAKRRYAATASSADRYFLTPSPASTGSVTPVTYRPE
jgi:deoxyribodipyrimidine photo-lyase